MRYTVNPTQEIEGAILEHQKEHGFQTFAQALLDLAAKGLQAETGQEVKAIRQWGGLNAKKVNSTESQ